MKKAKPKAEEERCPHCGYCKHCGQSKPLQPYVYPWYLPTWIWTQPTTVDAGTITVASYDTNPINVTGVQGRWQ